METKTEILCEMCGERTDNAEVVKALGEWFERRGVPYEKMDADTAALWRIFKGV